MSMTDERIPLRQAVWQPGTWTGNRKRRREAGERRTRFINYWSNAARR